MIYGHKKTTKHPKEKYVNKSWQNIFEAISCHKTFGFKALMVLFVRFFQKCENSLLIDFERNTGKASIFTEQSHRLLLAISQYIVVYITIKTRFQYLHISYFQKLWIKQNKTKHRTCIKT